MTVNLLTAHHLEYQSLKGGCTGSSESTFVKMPHCWKSHVAAQFAFSQLQCLDLISAHVCLGGNPKKSKEKNGRTKCHIVGNLMPRLNYDFSLSDQMFLGEIRTSNGQKRWVVGWWALCCSFQRYMTLSQAFI